MQARTDDLSLLSIAADVQGVEAAGPYVEAARPDFTTAVDSTNMLGYLFGYKAVPNGVVLNSEGTVLYARYGGFSVHDEESVERVDAALKGKQIQAAQAPGSAPIPEEDARRVRELLRQGAEAVGRDSTRTAQLWREALRLDPNNYVIRKQIWALEHPDKFYPEIDWDWQHQQLRSERLAERAAR
ncbi:MAG: hypothetical protein M3P51_14900 [Chloroflexota bacterium]|nr:hypothetical protein [Chloroflexota bacterium]